MNIPKIDTLMEGLSESGGMTPLSGEEQQVTKIEGNVGGSISMESVVSGTLWTELVSMLETSPADLPSQQKIYKIDSDIVETVAQCDFKGRSVCCVLNCMLRTFLIANIGNLDRLRRHSPSLFDSYLKKDK